MQFINTIDILILVIIYTRSIENREKNHERIINVRGIRNKWRYIVYKFGLLAAV